jgi:1,4-dihydroxy-2-naphthoate octaprenyltransferase
MTDKTERPVSSARVWVTALRPFAYPASILPVLLGTVLAWQTGRPVDTWGFVLVLTGVVCAHTAANLLNDAFDHGRGLDREVFPNSGAVVRGWLTARQVLCLAAWLLGVTLVCGTALTWMAGWPVAVLAVAGILLCLAYTGPGFCLKYNGLGDPAVFVAFGVLPVIGAFWVQAQTFQWMPLFWSTLAGAHVVAILHANNWTDRDRDRRAGCRTSAMLLGNPGAAIYYRVLILAPYVLTVMALAATYVANVRLVPFSALAVLLSLPAAIRLARVTPEGTPSAFAELDSRTACLQMRFGTLLVIGFALGRIF